MMLVHSTPASIDDHANQESSCVWLSNDDTWQEPKNSVSITLTKHKSKDNTLWSHNLLSSSELSTAVIASKTPTLNHVYKRKMTLRNVLPLNSSSIPTLVYKRRKVQCDNSKSGSVDGEFIEDPKSKKCSGLHINDSCSSTKSTVLKQVDDVGECSSSSVEIMDGTNSCFLFSKQNVMLERCISTKKTTGQCLKACKVCDRLTKTLKMLICDLCEESFHMSCCNPVIKKVPVDDWFCNSCSRKKLKKMETNVSKLPESCFGPVASVLRDSDPFTSNVRIGEEFQAEIPDWSGPLTDEINGYLEPMEVTPLDCASYQEWDSRKLSRLSSIGNWLQCREVVDDVDGTICGKWRRAPLFEVQSDDWECFSSVLWDPTHADCAVPQELDTDQVLKQLKYIEMLRPRLSAKRWKLGANKRVEDPRNTQKS